ncbi:hypothetical protein L593_06870 [Salinarchaeum sp. Harcht-Bsk1]|uniref:DUF7261 family protein n=1 Tax=Salinarchaeum sp. Harcht-Bsk1 TaxID=1333523 RepID=UPI0003423F23|nr:hypothetical protein [Salinarchaeum sp. Harcht-Bsk1]AGN01321.1 hypothetical protein L593_06870 [Salinarchaeum sp. Harcht-Bsk1]
MAPVTSGASGGSEGDERRRLVSRRSQLVLVAAGVIAMGLLPIVLAYTQLGYAGMAATEPSATTATADAHRAIERAAFDASEPSQGVRPWAARSGVADEVASRFDDRVASIETGRIERGIHHAIERNTSAASAWASANCPGGSSRQFGPCEAREGIVLQERGGDTQVLAIAVDLRTLTEDATYTGTYLLDAETGTGRGQ